MQEKERMKALLERERLKELLKKRAKKIKSLEDELEGYRELVRLSGAFVLAAARERGEVRLSRREVSKAVYGDLKFEKTDDEYIIRAEVRGDDADTDAQGDNKRGADNGARRVCEKGQ